MRKWLRRLISGQAGSVIVASIYMVVVVSFFGVALLGLAISETNLVGKDRKGAQAFGVAEAGIDKAIWYLRTPPSEGGKGASWTTAPPGISVEQALATGAYHIQETVDDAFGQTIGNVSIVVQNTSSISQRRITAMGLEAQDNEKPKYLQAVVDLTTAPGKIYRYSMFFNGNNSVSLENLLLDGGIYTQVGATVNIGENVRIVGDVFAHHTINFNGPTHNDVTGAIYSFSNINGTGFLDQHGSTTLAADYNGGISGGSHTHTAEFPEVEMGTGNDRAYYRANSDLYFPADAATNLSANAGTIEFTSDGSGNILYDSSCCGSGMALDNFGNPFRFGTVFVAGDIKVHGTFNGAFTLVAAGSGEGSGGEFLTTGAGRGDLYIGDLLRQAPDGTDNLASVDPGAGDGIGLVAANVGIENKDNPSYVRALIWSKYSFYIEGGDVLTTYPSKLTVLASIWETDKQLNLDGSNRNLEIYLDTGLTDNPPPGVQGTVGVTVDKKQWIELTPAG